MLSLLLSVLLVLGCLGSVQVHEDVQTYKVVSISNNAHIVEVETSDGAVFTYYQEKQSYLCTGDQCIDVNGLLVQCEDNNTYKVNPGEYLDITEYGNRYIVTTDFIVTIECNK